MTRAPRYEKALRDMEQLALKMGKPLFFGAVRRIAQAAREKRPRCTRLAIALVEAAAVELDHDRVHETQVLLTAAYALVSRAGYLVFQDLAKRTFAISASQDVSAEQAKVPDTSGKQKSVEERAASIVRGIRHVFAIEGLACPCEGLELTLIKVLQVVQLMEADGCTGVPVLTGLSGTEALPLCPPDVAVRN